MAPGSPATMYPCGETHPIRILLIDDHAIVRAGYRRLLDSCDHIEIAAEAASGEEAYRCFLAQPSDVVITDLSLPGISGLETIRRIRRRDSEARVLVFTVHEEPDFVERALEAGALGYVTKSSPPDELLSAIDTVAAGGRYLCGQARARLAQRSSNQALEQLSHREFEILRLLAEGRTVGDIATVLSLSVKTVANYNTSIKAKLGVATAAQLARVAINHRLVSPG